MFAPLMLKHHNKREGFSFALLQLCGSVGITLHLDFVKKYLWTQLDSPITNQGHFVVNSFNSTELGLSVWQHFCPSPHKPHPNNFIGLAGLCRSVIISQRRDSRLISAPKDLCGSWSVAGWEKSRVESEELQTTSHYRESFISSENDAHWITHVFIICPHSIKI